MNRKREDMETQVTKTEAKLPVDMNTFLDGDEDFRAEDLQAPQITLMQSTSDLVKEGDLNPGDVVRGGEKLMDKKDQLEISALTYTKKWIVSEHKGGASRGVFRGTRNMDAGTNDHAKSEVDKTGFNLPLKFEVEGVPYERTKLLEVFCLLKQDLESMPTPCVIWIRGGAYNRAGKALMSYFAFSKAAGEAPQLRCLSLGTTVRKNDQGSWFEFTVKPSEKLEEVHYPTVRRWYDIVKDNKVSADTTQEETTPKTNPKRSRF